MPDLPTQQPEDLPEGTRFTDVLEAAQAAWMAGSYELSRELIQRYIDPLGEFCCMRCTKMEHEPWSINNHLGKFRVCPACATIVTQQKELMQRDGGELYAIGPVQKIQKSYRQGITTIVETSKSQTKIMITGEDKNGRQRGALIAAYGHDTLEKYFK